MEMREMISFELGKEIVKYVFNLVTSVGQRKKFWGLMRNRTSDLRIPRSDVLSVSHRDSTMSKVYQEVLMARILHAARISSVDSVMFVNRMT